MLSNQVPCAKQCAPCMLAQFPLPADRAVLEGLILVFVEMFLSPLDYISSLCGLAFPALWGCHHVGIGMIMRNLCRLSSQGYTCHPNAGEMGPLHPAFLGASYYRSPQRYLASEQKAAQLSPEWAEHTWEPHLFQDAEQVPGKEKGLCGLPSSKCFSRIPQMEQLRIWALEVRTSSNPTSATSLT